MKIFFIFASLFAFAAAGYYINPNGYEGAYGSYGRNYNSGGYGGYYGTSSYVKPQHYLVRQSAPHYYTKPVYYNSYSNGYWKQK